MQPESKGEEKMPSELDWTFEILDSDNSKELCQYLRHGTYQG